MDRGLAPHCVHPIYGAVYVGSQCCKCERMFVKGATIVEDCTAGIGKESIG